MDARQAILSSLLEGGWSGLQDAQKLTQKDIQANTYEQAVREYSEAKLFAEVFSEGRGPELLALLRERCVYKVQFNPELEGMSAILNGFFRSGEANLVLFVERMIARAKQGPPTPPSEDKKTAEQDE